MTGPLTGITVIELGGLGPGPLCATMLADNGARVIRVDRPGAALDRTDVLSRSREVISLDLKSPADVETLLSLIDHADGLIEGMRPGVIEKLGLGPDVLLARRPQLVVGRMTGWGQTGPYADVAGHDINYIALSGALHAIGTPETPVPPLALVGDFGGGGMVLAFSMTAAFLHAQRTGQGQVIDCAMTEGAAALMAPFFAQTAVGGWKDERGVNLIDGGAHFYGVYKTADDKFVSIGSIEPQFYALLLHKLGLSDDADFAEQMDQSRWPRLRERLAAIFRSKTRAEWDGVFEGTDVCYAPVLSLQEVPSNRHMQARGVFTDVGGISQPGPVPRYSATQLAKPTVPVQRSSADVLGELRTRAD